MGFMVDAEAFAQKQDRARALAEGTNPAPIVGPDRLPSLIPEPEPDRERAAQIIERDAGLLAAEDAGYQRYIGGKALQTKVERAESLLELDLAPEERRTAAATAARRQEAKSEIRFGRQTQEDSKREREQLMRDEHPAYVAWACATEVELAQAADELAPVLKRYLEKWEQAASRWEHFTQGTINAVRERDAQHGHVRDQLTVRNDAELASCPLPADAVRLVLTAKPRPKVYSQEDDT